MAKSCPKKQHFPTRFAYARGYRSNKGKRMRKSSYCRVNAENVVEHSATKTCRFRKPCGLKGSKRVYKHIR